MHQISQNQAYSRLQRIVVEQCHCKSCKVAVENHELPARFKNAPGFSQRALRIDQMGIDSMRDNEIKGGVRLSRRSSLAARERHARFTLESVAGHLDEQERWVDSNQPCRSQVLHDEFRRSAVAATYLERAGARGSNSSHVARANRLHGRLGRPNVHRARNCVEHLRRLLFNAREQISQPDIPLSLTTTRQGQDARGSRAEARPNADRRDDADTVEHSRPQP